MTLSLPFRHCDDPNPKRTTTRTKQIWIQACQDAKGKKKETFDGLCSKFGSFGFMVPTPEEVYDKIMEDPYLDLTYLGDLPQKLYSRLENCCSRWNLKTTANSDITSLEKLTYSQQLTCCFCGEGILRYQFHDITPLSVFLHLSTLHLWNHQISDITPLQNLTNLFILDLRCNDIDEITPLSNLHGLEQLSLSGNRISNVRPLSILAKLRILHLDVNQIIDIYPLSNLVQLMELSINHNQILDLRPLSELQYLKWLSIDDNCISNLRPLSSLRNLEHVTLGGNYITDFDPINHVLAVRGEEEQTIVPSTIDDLNDDDYHQNILLQQSLDGQHTHHNSICNASIGCVFLSHTGQDTREGDFIVFLNESLKSQKNRIPTFLDAEKIKYGSNWMSTIQYNVEHCSLFVCNFSESYPIRYWPMRELDLAFLSNRQVLPIFHSTKSIKVNWQLRKQMRKTLKCKKDLLKVEGETVDVVLERWCQNLHRLNSIQGVRNESSSKKTQAQFRDKVTNVIISQLHSQNG